MNKAELITALADATGFTKIDSCAVLDALIETIESTVAGGNDVVLVGFGTFKTTHREARQGRNPQTGASIQIAASTLPKFQPGTTFKTRVAKAAKSKKPAAKPKKKAAT